VSGQELCEHYGVSRTAVWKVIKQLEKDGYVIEAQNNKGYRLVEKDNADVFTRVEIESCLDTSWIGRKLVFHRETGSTNLDAKALAESGEAAGAVVVAGMETAGCGRGRRGRGGTHILPFLLFLFFSFLLFLCFLLSFCFVVFVDHLLYSLSAFFCIVTRFYFSAFCCVNGN